MSTMPVPWLTTLHDWPRAALSLLSEESAIVRVLVAAVRGSAPRESGVAMLVAPERVVGTIGGGQLEWQALAAARALLSEAEPSVRVQRLVLGADLAQCCGGVVELWIERLSRADRPLLARAQAAAQAGPTLLRSTLGTDGLVRTLLPTLKDHAAVEPHLTRATDGGFSLLERLDDARPSLWLYGAGYVGQAVARLLLELPLRLTWIDARPHLFPSDLPAAVTVRSEDVLASVADAPAGAHCLVMTHSHALDYALVHALLERNDLASLGLIGSQSKAARFRSRLKREGVSAERLARLTCPIGIAGITSKWPAAIAVAVAAQLLQRLGPSNEARTGESAAPADCSGDCGRCQTGAVTAR